MSSLIVCFRGGVSKWSQKGGNFRKRCAYIILTPYIVFTATDDANFSEVSQQLSLQWEPLKLTKYWKKTSTAKKCYNFEIESSAKYLQLS